MEDGSDDGDGYDYSPIENDWIITSRDAKAKKKIIHYPYSDHATVSFQLKVPYDLEERRSRKMNGHIDITLDIDLQKKSNAIQIKATVDNQAKDHRVIMYIPQTVASQFTLADHQFGSIERKTSDPAIEVWQKEHWSERPDAIYPMLSYVKMKNDRLSFLTDSIREYEAIDEQTLAITLYRCTGYLGKEELLRRPGRPSGIKMATPDQQMLGINSYDFALACVNNDEIAKAAKEYLTPVITYNKMPYNAMKLNEPAIQVPYHYSFLTIDQPAFILSALKKSEYDEGYILRGYNPLNADEKVVIKGCFDTMKEMKLDEETVLADRINELQIKHNEVKTVYIK